MISIIQGFTSKPEASRILCEFFNKNKDYYDGWLYIGYPIIRTGEDVYSVDALWISKKKGLIIFDLIEGQDKDLQNYQNIQDDHYNKIQSKLLGYKHLVKKRKLIVDINIITFYPSLPKWELIKDEEYPLCNEENLPQILDEFSWQEGNENNYKNLLSTIQTVSTIRKGKKREVHKANSRGEKLQKIEDSIATLDNHQNRAVIETVDGIQRIRGLAGSGKTIVLALKAAYLHAQNPDWKIAVTFNTRSLKGLYRKFITSFYIQQKGEEPDWEHLNIIHAWGAPGGGLKNGLYYEFCDKNGLKYYDFNAAVREFSNKNPFGAVCTKALNEAPKNCVEDYDVILVDEAQDFSPSFLQLCYRLLKNPKRLVYAYDELQNLGRESLPSLEKIFGENSVGVHVQMDYINDNFSPQDIILSKCYRNSRPALVTAHALGFGIYRTPDKNEKTGIIQMFENSTLWEDIGYEVIRGELSDGKKVELGRTPNTSPLFLEEHSSIDDLICFKCFESKEEEDFWVRDQIKVNLEEEELNYDDIIVINPNPLTTRKNVANLRALLFDEKIPSHIAGVDSTPDVFFSRENSIVFTGIYRAKGNEAGMVYIVNAEECFTSENLAEVRNILFTAITRSKAWVRVLGVGEKMQQLTEEYNKIKKHKYKLNFIYPTKEQRQHMNIVNRDKSNEEKAAVKNTNRNLNKIIEGLQNHKLYKEDIDPEILDMLQKLLKL